MAGTNPYGNPYSSFVKELNLRTEVHKILYGSSEETAKGRVGLIRRMRRGSDGHLIRCECVDPITDEHVQDRYCASCHGMGYYWDEVKFVYFKNDRTYRNKEENISIEFGGNVFYTEYSNSITKDDYIVELALDSSGNVIIPIVREKLYRVLDAIEERSDNGRIEFIAIKTVEERKWSTYYGVYNRQYEG
jgi:hypothetical protein